MNIPTTTPHPRIVSKKTLLIVSAIADALDFITIIGGLGPTPVSVFIDMPITILHFLYAGPAAWPVLAEYIPFVGYLPCYTIAAMIYRDNQPPLINPQSH